VGDPGVAASETHVSWLIFLPTHVYKVKKPVTTGFLDFSTSVAREHACAEEVRLNRRLAPDVYDGVAHVVGPDARREPIVVMRRMPAERRLATLVRSGDPSVAGHLDRLVRLLVDFHAGAERSDEIDEAGRPAAVSTLWRHNIDELRPFRGTVLDTADVDAVDRLATRYLHGRAGLFDGRVAAGRICDGHGDLLSEDIFCLDDGPRVLDCLEFDPRLRHGDVLADLAFLAMDLERLGRPDLGRSLLESYRQRAGDEWADSLADHWIAYRALVRAKVACLRSAQGDDAAAGEARALLELSLAHLRSATVRLVLVGGAPGTGKSALAAALGERMDLVVLRSDVVRRELAGPAPPTGTLRAAGHALSYLHARDLPRARPSHPDG